MEEPTVTGGKIDDSAVNDDYMDQMMKKQKQSLVYTKLSMKDAD